MAAKSFLANAPVCPWQAFPDWSNICELGQEPALERSTWEGSVLLAIIKLGCSTFASNNPTSLFCVRISDNIETLVNLFNLV
jgi:hypothetical protein